MKTYTFTKQKGWWFIHLPAALCEYNGTDFARVEKTGGVLDKIAGGATRVSVSMDTRPLRKASVLELKASTATADLGGCYRLRNQEGVLLKRHLLLIDLSLLLYGEFPERIYLRKK